MNPVLISVRTAAILALGVLVSGCRSGSGTADVTPKSPADSVPAAAATATPAADAPPTVAKSPTPDPTTPALGEAPEASSAVATAGDAPAQPVEEAVAEAAAPGDPAASQKEALELCQAAKDAAEGGDIEKALSSADRAYELMLALPAEDNYLQAKEDIRLLVADVIGSVYRTARAETAKPAASWDLGLGLLDNDHVQREIRSFTNGEREGFIEAYRRSGRYRPMMLAKLADAGLPSQLSWLPLVESAFKVRALSRASALGLCQFISSTGLRYNLNRDTWVDERLDPEKSTDAAIRYLADLHALFGDWPKALAAYNCGEGRVMRLSRTASDYMDFWDLYQQLPGETRRYVPRLFAALQILEDPAKYGLNLPETEPAPVTVARVRVERSVALDKLDATLGLPAGTLAELNPELRYQATPRRAYDLRVPAGGEPTVLTHIASLPEWKNPRPDYVSHRVRSGETLGAIARKYGASVSAIQKANGLRSHRIRVGQRLRIPVFAKR